jgi:hypothetical protein
VSSLKQVTNFKPQTFSAPSRLRGYLRVLYIYAMRDERFITVMATLLYMIGGAASTYLYLQGYPLELLPPFVFTSITVIAFVLTKTSFGTKNVLRYYAAMIILYFVVYLGTFLTFWLAFIAGIFTTGYGAVLVFKLTQHFIRKAPFNMVRVFIMGGMSFVANDILLMLDNAGAFRLDLTGAPQIYDHFFFTYFVWQSLVGMQMVFWLKKKRDNLS